MESDSLLPWVILRINWVDFSNAHDNAWHSENTQWILALIFYQRCGIGMYLTCMAVREKWDIVMSSEVKCAWQEWWVWARNTEGYNWKA